MAPPVKVYRGEPQRIQGVLPSDSGLLCTKGRTLMDPLALVKLLALMKRTSGKSEIVIGLIDGPI